MRLNSGRRQTLRSPSRTRTVHEPLDSTVGTCRCVVVIGRYRDRGNLTERSAASSRLSSTATDTAPSILTSPKIRVGVPVMPSRFPARISRRILGANTESCMHVSKAAASRTPASSANSAHATRPNSRWCAKST